MKGNKKTSFLVSQKLSFRLKKQTNKNVADKTFKQSWEALKITSNFCEKRRHDYRQLHCVRFSAGGVYLLRGFIGFYKSQQMND